jgi:hypothetical protein
MAKDPAEPVLPAGSASDNQAGAPDEGTPSRPAGDDSFWRHKSIEELAAEKGVKPVTNPEELRGDFWPEDESIDDFLAWLRELRRQGRRND